MTDDPFVQFGAWFSEALGTEPGEPNAMTLATATTKGVVSARMVLLRGFDHGGFDFFTNYESRKGRELSENSRVALVLHWEILQRQVCITGSVVRLDPARSDAYFASRPRGHQIAAWASEQSSTLE
ncbi:MAG: pyridoxal 5'-phosphate synthase, partial [Actinomycetota bacterium]